MTPFARLQIGRQKFVAGRTFVSEAMEDCIHLCGGERKLAFESFASISNSLTKAVLSQDSGEDESLGQFLEELPVKISQGLPRSQRERTKEIADSIGNRFGAVDLAAYDPFDDFWRTAASAAEHFYTHFVGIESDAEYKLVPVVSDNGRMHPFKTEINISGLTRVSAKLEVQLLISGDSFGLEERWASPYVLLHEMLVHGYASREAVTYPGNFADGWMDFVAWQLHNAMMSEPASFGGLGSGLERPGRAITFGNALHEARYHSWSELNLGRKAAQLVAQRIELIGIPEAREAFWRLSGAINRSSLGQSTREEMTESLASWLGGPEHPAPIDAELARFFDADLEPDALVDAASRFGLAVSVLT